jgi:hypothetical protein
MMKIALVLPFVLIAIAPFIGKWRANVWLRKYSQRERAEQLAATNTLAETA